MAAIFVTVIQTQISLRHFSIVNELHFYDFEKQRFEVKDRRKQCLAALINNNIQGECKFLFK